jgi:hypothetical protein
MSYFIVTASRKTLSVVDTQAVKLLSFGVIIVLPGGIPIVQVDGLRERGKVQEHLEWINDTIKVGSTLRASWGEAVEPVQPRVVGETPRLDPIELPTYPLSTGRTDSAVKNEADTSGIVEGFGFIFDIVLPTNRHVSMKLEGEGTLQVTATWNRARRKEWAIDAGSFVGSSSQWFSTTLTARDWIEVKLRKWSG